MRASSCLWRALEVKVSQLKEISEKRGGMEEQAKQVTEGRFSRNRERNSQLHSQTLTLSLKTVIKKNLEDNKVQIFDGRDRCFERELKESLFATIKPNMWPQASSNQSLQCSLESPTQATIHTLTLDPLQFAYHQRVGNEDAI